MFKVILFKNNKKKKVLKSFKTEKKANDFFDKLIINSEKVKFREEFNSGSEVEYNIGIIGDKVILEKIFYTDSFGRTIYINPKIGNEYIQKIKDFNKEETIFDFQTKQKISYDDLVKKYFKNDEVYMVSKLNNKIVIQNQTITNIFSLKNEYDCSRLVDILQSDLIGKTIVSKDINTIHRKYIYNLLVEKGFKKDYLYRKRTTHPKQKWIQHLIYLPWINLSRLLFLRMFYASSQIHLYLIQQVLMFYH